VLIDLYDNYLEATDDGTRFQLKVSIKDAFSTFCEKWSAYDAEVALDATKRSIGFREWLTRNDENLDDGDGDDA